LDISSFKVHTISPVYTSSWIHQCSWW